MPAENSRSSRPRRRVRGVQVSNPVLSALADEMLRREEEAICGKPKDFVSLQDYEDAIDILTLGGTRSELFEGSEMVPFLLLKPIFPIDQVKQTGMEWLKHAAAQPRRTPLSIPRNHIRYWNHRRSPPWKPRWPRWRPPPRRETDRSRSWPCAPAGRTRPSWPGRWSVGPAPARGPRSTW